MYYDEGEVPTEDEVAQRVDGSGRRRPTRKSGVGFAKDPIDRHQDPVDCHLRKSHLFPLFGTYQWMCDLVGADVIKIFGHMVYHSQKRINAGVHKCTPFCTNKCNL